ncbi:DUF4097 domain-containing protein [Paraeggerthella hongkongensis]|uniref:DUF4097 domain-containing protein n=1 Tax=Paraeggerthella hominis TaxID=2897351 RepID=UPI001C105BCD|nr:MULTISPECIES: DUF4097 domain-containing protein [Paraeggerthella]MBU5406296.1 DUF4097 domain-containing protein [Paraeggerthella hongkongensis]MCD2432978.1 DUF4097 domain-containing protein [Paraeggerthella hominis]
MSKGKKTLLIVATTLVVSGCAISFGAFAAAGFDPVNLSTESRDWTPATKTFDPETENPHTAIVLRDAGENVRIEPTDGDAIEVTCWTNEQKRFDVTDDGGTITVKGSRESYIGIMMIGSFEDHTTVVKVPRSYVGTLDVDLMSGSMDMTSLDGLDSVTAKTASGDVKLARLVANDITTSTASGNVLISNARCSQLNATTMSGNVDLSDIEASEIVKLDTTSGSQLLRGVSTLALDAHIGSGDILATNVSAVDAKFDAVSGSVSASFVGSDREYAIEASSASGSVHAPAGSATASRHVSAHTTSGDVTLTFSGGGASGSESSASNPPSFPEAPEAPKAPEAPAAPTL